MELASIIISGVAILVAVGNLIWTQSRMDKREGIKWRRDTLTKATSEFIAASEGRNQLLILNRDNWSKEHNNQQISLLSEMKQCRNQFWIAGAEEIYEQAGAVMEMHVEKAKKGKLQSVGAISVDAIVDVARLNEQNSQLIVLTRQYINSKNIKKSVSKIPQDFPRIDRRMC